MHVYAFLNELKEQFPGYVKINTVSINRDRALTNDILLQLSRGSQPELVTAEISFLWLGLRQVNQEDTNG
jgi:hypothetical protein